MKSYKDIYEFPLRHDEGTDWVYDAKNQFVFQFEIGNPILIQLIMDKLNGIDTPSVNWNFTHNKGEISDNNTLYIIIRGWGNLTGSSALNLPIREAENIQDTFAEFIVNTLNSKGEKTNR